MFWVIQTKLVFQLIRRIIDIMFFTLMDLFYKVNQIWNYDLELPNIRCRHNYAKTNNSSQCRHVAGNILKHQSLAWQEVAHIVLISKLQIRLHILLREKNVLLKEQECYDLAA